MEGRTKKATQITEMLTDKSPNQTVEASIEMRRSGKLLSSGEAAATLGISRSELRRREELGMYEAAFITDKGWHFYDPEYLSTLPNYGNHPRKGRGRQKAVVKADVSTKAFPKKSSLEKDFYNPREAGRIFKALDEGMSSRDIVQTLSVHPDTMVIIYEAWKKLGTLDGGGIQLSARILEAINELPLPGTYPITNAEQLLTNLREAAKETPMCTSCKKQACRICLGCAEAIYQSEPIPTKMGRPRKSA